jgi:hypothetical protein
MNRTVRTLSFALTALLIGWMMTLPGAEVASAQQEVDTEQTRTVSTSGTGQISVQPDVAVVRLGVETQAESAAAALAQNNEQMQALIDTLTQAGVASESIQTQTIRLQPIYEGGQPATGQQPPMGDMGEREVIGYRATNIVEVRTENLDNLGELLDAAVTAGGNRIEGIRFEVSDPTGVLDRARERAWSQARNKAEQLASLADAELGEVLSINEFSQTPSPVQQEAALAADVAAVPISPGSQMVNVDVQVTWRLR